MNLFALALLSALGGALPYVRLHVDTGTSATYDAHCLWWPAGTVAMQQALAGNPATGGGEFDAVTRSIGTWGAQFQGCGNLTLDEGPRTSDRTVGFNQAGSNTNLVIFRQNKLCQDVVPQGDACWKDSVFACANEYDCWPHSRGAIAMTTNTYEVRTGKVFDADIELNAGYFQFTAWDGPTCVPPNYTGGCVAYDVQNTVTHELGHVVGLDHSPDPGSTMYASAPLGEISKRTLDPGSEQFVCDVYPKGSYSRDCVVERLDPHLSGGCQAAPGAWGLGALAALAALALRRGRA